LLLAAFIDRFAYGSISLRHYAIRGLLPLGFAFAGYQVLLRQLSHVIYGTAPSVASWRSPREITEIKSFLLNFGAFVREILSIGSLTPAAFLGFILLTSTVTSIALTNATTRNTGIRMTTAIAAAFGLYVLNFLPTLAYGIAIPPRALFAAAISFCLVFLVLDNEAMESVARQRNRILVSLIPMTFSLIFLGSNLLHSRSNAADFREQYEKMSAVVEAIDDLTDVEEVQEVILIARKFEPPFATGWIQPNVRYYFGERGYKFSVTFLDSDEDMSRFESQRGGSQAVIRKTGTIVYVEW
jgi:hypothetical protein